VAEHAPQGKRGFFTAWIQTTATMGLFLSLLVILAPAADGRREFAAWGWRIPFLVSVLLLGISVWIRLSMNESPAFAKMKAEGKTSKAPLSEAFGQWKNAKIVILALIGLTMGQAVVWYTGQFYALFFLTQTLKIDGATANILIAIALLLARRSSSCSAPVGPIGRKWIILGGCLIAAADLLPDLQGPDPLRQPGAGNRPEKLASGGGRRSCDLPLPVQPDRHQEIPILLRHRHRHADRQLGELHHQDAPAGSWPRSRWATRKSPRSMP
jgi:MFS family permease